MLFSMPSRLVWKQMKDSSLAGIINVSSVAGLRAFRIQGSSLCYRQGTVLLPNQKFCPLEGAPF